MESRQSLKLTSGVRFAPSQPQPGRSAAGRCSLTADVDGSSPSPLPNFRRVSFKGQDRTLRTFRLPFESAYPYQSGLRPTGRGRSAPNAEIPVRIRRAGPVLRGGGRAAKAPDRLSGPEGFDSLPSRQFYCGVEHDRPSALTFNLATVGPAYPTGCEAHRDEQAALNRQAERSIRSAPTSLFWGSKAAMRPAVNRETRRFESCPQSHFCWRSSVAEPAPYKRVTGVRFATPACRATPLAAETGPTNQHS